MSFNFNVSGSSVKVVNINFYGIINYIANLNVDIVCHITFLLTFFLYECILKVRAISDKFYWYFKDFFYVPRSRNTKEIHAYLEERKRTFKKLPDHLVLILGPEKASYKDLAKLISWCEPLGISHISFYDYKKGVDPLSIFEAVKNCNKHIIHKIKWGKSFTEDIKKASIREINGYRWEGLIHVNILSKVDGSLDLVNVSKHLHLEGEKMNVDRGWLSTALERRLGAPPPDLAVVCGPVLSYYACLPWHIRLTQFVHIQTHHSMGVSKFLNCLHQYSHCEQRFGK